MNSISALIKETPENHLALLPCENITKYEPETGPHQTRNLLMP